MTYITTDLGCAVTLFSFGYEFVINESNKNIKRKKFMFVGSGSDLIASQYFTNKLNLNPKNFFENMKIVKSMLYADKE